MTDHSVFKLAQPGTFCDPLTEVLRTGARALLAQAVEAEVAAFLDSHTGERTADGRQRVVRHGHLPEREIMTGIGPVMADIWEELARDRENMAKRKATSKYWQERRTALSLADGRSPGGYTGPGRRLFRPS